MQPGEAAPPPRPRARSGVTVGWVRSDLIFDDELDADLDRLAVVGSTDLFLGDDLTLQIATGALVDGALDASDGVSRDLGPGWLLSTGLTWRVLDDLAPTYVLLSVALGATGTRTVADPPAVTRPLRGDYLGIDGRFGVTAGRTFGDVFSPYVAARAFGGPILWTEDDVTRLGTDRWHVQVAAGAALLLGPVDLFVEGAPLGERGVAGGIGIAY